MADLISSLTGLAKLYPGHPLAYYADQAAQVLAAKDFEIKYLRSALDTIAEELADEHGDGHHDHNCAICVALASI